MSVKLSDTSIRFIAMFMVGSIFLRRAISLAIRLQPKNKMPSSGVMTSPALRQPTREVAESGVFVPAT